MNKSKNEQNTTKSSCTAEKSVTISSNISITSSTSAKYNSVKSSSSNSETRLNSNRHISKYNTVSEGIKLRPAISTSTTAETAGKQTNLSPSYTSVYPPRRSTIAGPSTSTNISSKSDSSPDQSNDPRNHNPFTEVCGSMSKPRFAPNNSRGLFHSFDDQKVPPKQSLNVPANTTAATFSSHPTPSKPALIDRPVPPPSSSGDRPVANSSVYVPRRYTFGGPSTSTNISSKTNSSPYQSTDPRNYNAFSEVPGSMSKPRFALNDSRGLSHSFDDQTVKSKQSTATFSSHPTPSKPTLIDRPVPSPSLIVDRPVKNSFFNRTFTSNRKRGYALILNHYKYENGKPSTREGTNYDVEKLKTVFAKYNIETIVKTDLKLNQIKSEVNNLKLKNFSKYECFIIVILTHGERNEVLHANDKSYNYIDEIEDPLFIENKSLLDKPKIFIIQACRGIKMPFVETDSLSSSPGSGLNFFVAKRNIFKCYATYEGYVSFRNTRSGTIFIQKFCDKLTELGKTKSIYEIMMEVIDEVSNNPETPQVPIVNSKMISPFYFGSLLE